MARGVDVELGRRLYVVFSQPAAAKHPGTLLCSRALSLLSMIVLLHSVARMCFPPGLECGTFLVAQRVPSLALMLSLSTRLGHDEWQPMPSISQRRVTDLSSPLLFNVASSIQDQSVPVVHPNSILHYFYRLLSRPFLLVLSCFDWSSIAVTARSLVPLAQSLPVAGRESTISSAASCSLPSIFVGGKPCATQILSCPGHDRQHQSAGPG